MSGGVGTRIASAWTAPAAPGGIDFIDLIESGNEIFDPKEPQENSGDPGKRKKTYGEWTDELRRMDRRVTANGPTSFCHFWGTTIVPERLR
jgi:hypothetical protein